MTARSYERWVRAVVASTGRDPHTWWMARLLGRSWVEPGALLTGSPAGSLVAIAGLAPAGRGITMQPGADCSSDALAEIVAGAGAAGPLAARALLALGPGHGPTRGRWPIAVGTSVLGDAEEVRVYVGALNPADADDLARWARDAEPWCAPLDPAARRLVDGLCRCGTLFGHARRYGSDAGFTLYVGGSVPLAEAWDCMERVVDAQTLACWKAFVRLGVSWPVVEPGQFGWGVSLDASGSVASVKLEISDACRPIDALPGADAPFVGAIAALRRSAAACGVTATQQTVAVRARGPRPDVTAYFGVRL